MSESRVLVLGSSGFIGKNLTAFLRARSYSVLAISSAELDLLDASAVIAFFASHPNFDAIAHCCAVGGSRLLDDDESVFFKNVRMVDNVLACRQSFAKFVYFSSGAAIYAKETPYGFSKHIIDKILRSEPKAFNFRVFGCFGPHELPRRFISGALQRAKQKLPIVIHQDRLFDFVFVDDLCRLVELAISGSRSIQHEIDVAHQEKLCLSEIAGLISEDVIIENPGLGEPYIGKTSIDGLFEQIGVRAGIKSFATTLLLDKRNG